MTNYPKISIIIVNWNGKQYLSDCLTSIFRQSYGNFEVILVDNGSIDKSIGFVKDNFPEVKVIILDKNYGFAKGNNIGIREALKDENVNYIALLNNDTKVAPDWLEKLIKIAELNGLAGAYQPKMVSFTNPNMIDAIGIGLTKDGVAYQMGYNTPESVLPDQVIEIFGACGGAVLYRREMLTDVGLFDEDFFAYLEDVDLSLRARLRGWKSFYVPNALVYHKASATGGKNLFLKRHLLCRNTYYYTIKNFHLPQVIRTLIRLVGSTLNIITQGFLNKFQWSDNPYLKGNLEALQNIPKLLRKRRKIQSERLIKNADLIKWFNL